VRDVSTLPRCGLALVLALAACGGGRVATPPPVTPIAAASEAPLRPAAEVCGELVTELDRYEGCVEDDRKPLIHAWSERAKIDFAALAHAGVSDADRAAAARACAKTSAAVHAAVAACPAQTR
jgi:hypothetical protein